jgi:hypothetical protein
VERSARNHSGKCGFEHLELAEWLKELKAYKEQEPCVDCVSREQALDCVDKRIDELKADKRFNIEKEICISGVKKHILSLPPVTPAQRWIPVSERLPEKSMRCLVTVGRFNFTEIATYSDLMGIINHKIFYQGEVGHDSFVDITQYVKAWMPLPEPYKGGKEE